VEFLVDLTTAQLSAGKVRDCLLDWRQNHDLSAFEYTQHVRIAPLERPHSHPVLTISTQLFNPDEILCEYLHEQMHWYETALGTDERSPLIAELERRYPHAPIEYPDGAYDKFSTYLHLLVNWLEIEAASNFMKRERAEEIARNKSYYRWIYRTVLSDWISLESLFRENGQVPIVPAADLLRAGRP
jgi:hypothetical protein